MKGEYTFDEAPASNGKSSGGGRSLEDAKDLGMAGSGVGVVANATNATRYGMVMEMVGSGSYTETLNPKPYTIRPLR